MAAVDRRCVDGKARHRGTPCRGSQDGRRDCAFCSVLTGDERAPTEVVRSRKFLVVTRRQGVWKVSRGPKAEGLVHAVIVHWADI